MHVVVVANEELVAAGTWDRARAHVIALRQATNVGHVAEGKPAGGLFREELRVDLGAHAAVVSDVMKLPAGHSSNGLDEVQAFIVAVRTFASDARAMWFMRE